MNNSFYRPKTRFWTRIHNFLLDQRFQNENLEIMYRIFVRKTTKERNFWIFAILALLSLALGAENLFSCQEANFSHYYSKPGCYLGCGLLFFASACLEFPGRISFYCKNPSRKKVSRDRKIHQSAVGNGKKRKIAMFFTILSSVIFALLFLTPIIDNQTWKIDNVSSAGIWQICLMNFCIQILVFPANWTIIIIGILTPICHVSFWSYYHWKNEDFESVQYKVSFIFF